MNDIGRKLKGIRNTKGALFILFAAAIVVTCILMCMESIACTLICMIVTMTIAMLMTSAEEIKKEQGMK